MSLPLTALIDKTWPFAASILGTAVAFGSLHSDVADLKAKQDTASKDHDAIVRIEERQTDMKQDLQDIKQYLHSAPPSVAKK